MRNSLSLLTHLENGLKKICAYDTREIDNLRPHHPDCLSYIDRIDTVLKIVKRGYPEGEGFRVGDFACAQGNLGLMLAEGGFSVSAVDIRRDFLRYSQMKYEHGRIAWICGNLDTPCFMPNTFDVIILGELIEHCAYPEIILAGLTGVLKSGGMILLTTPNGSRLLTKLPTFGSVMKQKRRAELEKRQYGPEAEDHLFLFTPDEILSILPGDLRVVESGYLGGTVMINRFTYRLLEIFPVTVIRRLIRIGSHIPVFNRLTYSNIYAVLIKQ